ncbi:VOC family protein [Conexibacter sp. SYSU D00693]|uniref:VOC family protein n=1 Tax=Conexibacter sp. SYSU D00693 TaxID=2812560 RepID=UPI00196B37AC|nr:VOC family protein [Conexibacter sp. SYSU D00693]
MSLISSPVRATVAVADIARAAQFYEDVLGLVPQPGGPEFVRIYPCGGGLLQVYASAHATPSGATVASWSIADFDRTIDELRTRGVVFERVDGMEADERGVHTFAPHQVAWCKDPDGNVLALDNGRTAPM